MSHPLLTSLGDLRGFAGAPGYDPNAHGAGIVHLGLGAFHRAHQAVMTDDALAQNGGDWRIIGVSLRSKEIGDRLNAQNGLYTLVERGAAAPTARVIGAIDRVISANPIATLEALCQPEIRVVTLTVTEKGYGIDPVARAPDVANPLVAADLERPESPQSVLGLLTAAIKRRRAAGSVPFTVLSCDNLPENGRLLRDGVIGFVRLSRQDELADWIAGAVAFPCSMVDRITPAVTQATLDEAAAQTNCCDQAAVETEPFIQWVIEDDFPSGRPQWEVGGALFVPDVTPYERMKLTMLNGSHSMVAYTSVLLGLTYVRDAMVDTDTRQLVRRHLAASAGVLPALPGMDFDRYAQDLEARFANPAIAHETLQIATDGTQKLPQRIFQPALETLTNRGNVRPFAFATAMWMRFCRGALDDGTEYKLNDPRAEALKSAAMKAGQSAADLSEAFHALPNLIPAALASDPVWRAHIEDTLKRALHDGCRAAVQHDLTQEARADVCV